MRAATQAAAQLDRGPLYRHLADRHGWDANLLSRMTPGQLIIYVGEDAKREDAERAQRIEQAKAGGAARA